MAQLDYRVHQYKMVKGEPELQRVLPYIRVSGPGDAPPIFIQGGKFFYAGGDEIKPKELPEWSKDALAALTPEAKAEVGLA